MPHFWKLDASPPRRRSARLGEPEAPKLLVYASPWERLLHLGISRCLREGPLSLGKPVVLFLSPFFC